MNDMAATRLARWMSDEGLNGAQLARLVGCTRSYIAHLTAGRMRPGLRIAAAIERRSATWKHGPIYCTEWLRPATPDPASAEPSTDHDVAA